MTIWKKYLLLLFVDCDFLLLGFSNLKAPTQPIFLGPWLDDLDFPFLTWLNFVRLGWIFLEIGEISGFVFQQFSSRISRLDIFLTLNSNNILILSKLTLQSPMTRFVSTGTFNYVLIKLAILRENRLPAKAPKEGSASRLALGSISYFLFSGTLECDKGSQIPNRKPG